MFGLLSKMKLGGPIAHRQEIGGTWDGRKRTLTSGLAAGLVGGTQVATAIGWRPVEAIIEGDLVLTFDRGLQPVRSVTRGVNWDLGIACPATLQPLTVPAGALGNQDGMTLLPEQSVLVESDTADSLFGDPFTLISAADLEGFRGIERVGFGVELEVIQLHFGADEIVFANRGALALCPACRMLGVDTLLAGATDSYRSLPSDEAAMLVECLQDEDTFAQGCFNEEAPVYAAAFA